jgi:hypothetical protein
MARIMALIKTRALVDSASSAEMETILMDAASGLDRPWGSREPSTAPLILRSKYVYNKLGLANLKPDSSGPEVRSECSLIKDPVAASRQYVVAWQNMQGLIYSFADISQVIIDTITQFEISSLNRAHEHTS